MTRPHVPQEVLDAAHARKTARLERDWAEADRLKAVIEAAGWRVVDRGSDFALSPAHAPDVVEGGHVRYGASESVPSRLSEAATALATVILRATDDPAALERSVVALRAHAPRETQLVVVADDPSPEVSDALDRLGAAGEPGLETLWTSARLGLAASINAGIRRAAGSVVIVLDAAVEPTGDIVTPLVEALADHSVAIAGAGGLAGVDIRDLADGGPGDVVALDGTCLAVRRVDASGRGPLDERFRIPRLLGTWWSLVLRDQDEAAPRRAIALGNLPVARRGSPADGLDPAERERSVKRDRYRILERFRERPDLMGGAAQG